MTNNGNGTFSISAAEAQEFRELQMAEAKRNQYRKNYNQRDDVKEKQRAYHRERNKLISEALKEYRAQNQD